LKNFLKITLVSAATIGLTGGSATADFSPFPLKELTLQFDEPVTIPEIEVGREYQINPCAFVLHTPDVICVPTQNGGFVLVPVGNGFSPKPEDLLGGRMYRGFGSVGYVVSEDDLVNFPPELWPYIREAPVASPSPADDFFRQLSVPYTVEQKDDGSEEGQRSSLVVTLPDGTSCPMDEIVTFELSPVQYEYICP